MLANALALWKQQFAALREDDRGAETSEIILALVVLVIGMVAAYRYIQGKLINKAEDTGDCIEGANDAAACN